MQVHPGRCKAGVSVAAIVTSTSCKGADGAREVVRRKNSGREWEEGSKPTQKAGQSSTLKKKAGKLHYKE